MALSEEARLARNAYVREWRNKNKDKVAEANRRYWERKFSENNTGFTADDCIKELFADNRKVALDAINREKDYKDYCRAEHIGSNVVCNYTFSAPFENYTINGLGYQEFLKSFGAIWRILNYFVYLSITNGASRQIGMTLDEYMYLEGIEDKESAKTLMRTSLIGLSKVDLRSASKGNRSFINRRFITGDGFITVSNTPCAVVTFADDFYNSLLNEYKWYAFRAERCK